MRKKKMSILLSVCMAMGMMLSGCGDESLEQIVSMIETGQADSGNDGGSAEIKASEGDVAAQKLNLAEISNPVHHCTKEDNGSDKTDWSYIYFGSYPQSEVTEDELTEAITGASYDENGDAEVEGVKYRRVSISDVERQENFGEDEYRYFKWEDIKWRVLQNNGSTLFVMAGQGLDHKQYNEKYGDITWEYCTLRSWLNNDFYYTAFDDDEQDAIAGQTVVNEDNPEYGTEGGNDTEDKVFLLSIEEIVNSEYGFCEDDGTYSASRRIEPSDYAFRMGADRLFNYSDERDCIWWLRSPGNDTDSAAYVDYYGHVCRDGYNVDCSRRAVAPALHINLSSDLWTVADESKQ